nr:pyridoxamine 5'-phosphate oxidase [uncultured bacterium]AMP55576.1 pyridoxamine 5'-phosphate oxidase [uncultured bacterium]AMP55600.1 pyridoxamine 5'-phosphate oxidase [uncultured bacterium]
MIRKDRKILDFDEIVGIIDQCDVCRIALNGSDGYPYILPLNFGYEIIDRVLTLYFHSAMKGRKHELIELDNRATFEMDCGHDLFSVESRGYCTMNYQSVVGHGRIEYICNEQDKFHALTVMTDRYHDGTHFNFNPAAMSRTSVYKLIVSDMIGKRKQSKRE